MSKARRKLKLKRVPKPDLCVDVTLNDFANSNSKHGRLKKTALQNVTTEIKILNLTENDTPWDEKLDILVPVVSNDEEDALYKRSRRRRKVTLESESSSSGVDYPIDIWSLISCYLSPEDVGTFAAICRTSNAVINSASFWFSSYKRWYRSVDSMPENLQPAYMVRRYGLRTLVIRSLYYMYPPFAFEYQTRLKSDPHALIGRLCVMSWSEKCKGKSEWVYSFKLKEFHSSIYGRKTVEPKPDLIEMMDDINANVDEGCKILQVKAKIFCPLPMIIGQKLLVCQIKMSSDIGSDSWLLQFGSGPSSYQSCPVSISNVKNTRVLDWWHPAFSHSTQLS